jgi:hypothetical protein
VRIGFRFLCAILTAAALAPAQPPVNQRPMKVSASELAATSSSAQTRTEAAARLKSYQRARATIERALTALGGGEVIRRAGGLVLLAEGTLNAAAEYQSRQPETPDLSQFTETLALDLTHDRLGYEPRILRRDGTSEWIRFGYQGQDQMLFAHLEERFAFQRQDAALADERQRLARMIPHVLLEGALRRPASLRFLGRQQENGGPVEAVLYTLASGETLTLLFGAEDGLLRGIEYLVDMPLRGDTVVRWDFGEHRPVSGLGLYPSGYRISVGGRVFKEVHYRSIQTREASRAAIFSLPEGITPPTSPSSSAAPGQQKNIISVDPNFITMAPKEQ